MRAQPVGGELVVVAAFSRLRRIVLAIVIVLAGLPWVPTTSAAPTIAPVAAVSGVDIGKVRWGYYVPYASTSLDSLKQNITSLNYLSPYWYTIDGNGDIITSDKEVDEKNRDVVLGLARANKVHLLPMIKNSAQYGDFTQVLANASVRQRAVDQIVDLVVTNKYDGIHIDFEGVNAEDRASLTAFMAVLAPKLRHEGKMVTQAVPAKDQERTTGWAGAYDYAALAPHNDLIVIMTYGYGVGVPQSTSPFPWVEASTAFAASQIPPYKVLLGLAWYGYDWNLTAGSVVPLRYADAMAAAKANNGTPAYDDNVQTAHFAYSVSGQQHEVWYEDSRSNNAKIDLVFKYGLGGAAGWRMGHEDDGVWSAFRDRLAFRTWYLAEGATTRPYDTWILIQNPDLQPVNATVTFLKEDGTTAVVRQEIGASSRYSIYANQVVPNAAFSTKVEATGPVFVERAMYFGYDGHDSAGVNTAARRWYLPEGTAKTGTDTWVLLMNPNTAPVTAHVTFLREGSTPITKDFPMKPTSRLNVWANQSVSDANFSTVIEADLPIVAERSSYADGGKAGYGSPGLVTLSKQWYMAEGFTGHQVQIAVMNTNKIEARTTINLLFENGTSRQTTLSVPPQSRATYLAPRYSPGDGFSVTLDSDQPVAVERTSFIPNAGIQGALAVPAPQRTWYLAEGSTATPFQTFLLLENPNATGTKARVTYMQDSGKQTVATYDLMPKSRYTVPVNFVVANAAVSMAIESDLPLVVERTMYFGRGAHASAGISQ